MKYDAVTVDTNIFDQKKLNLERGMLAQLKQFKEGSAKFILSEIVVREVHRHLTVQAEAAKQELKSAIRRSELTGLVDDTSLKALSEINEKALPPREAAKNGLKRWIEATGCEIVPAESANMKRLIAMYFAPEAPFEIGEKKKNEFPDAIALITLEDWAKRSQKKVLAITQDKGWIDFSAKSDWIDTETDLSKALQRFQEQTESARQVVAKLLSAFDQGVRNDELDEVKKRVADAVGELNPYAEATSAYHYDYDYVEMSFKDLHLVKSDDDNFEFQIVQTGEDEIVARLTVEISAEARAEFKYYLYDEGDQVRLGESSDRVEMTFEAGVLMTLQGEFPENYEVTDVELVDAIDGVDFGDIGPDYSDDRDYEE
ncbi:PIN domain-containing protein [Bradyrhizobium sp. USDA 4502]